MSGLLNRLFRRPSVEGPSALASTSIVYDGDDTLEVVGEASYQEALWSIVGGRSREPVRFPITAILLPEPENPVDANAICVRIDGHVVGYLSREDAVAYRPGLINLIAAASETNVALHGQVVGGGERRDGIGFLGVFLDHDPTDFGVVAHYIPSGSIRTGLSEAIATDLEDDSYDLSWLRTLGDDAAVACTRIEAFLTDEHDAIDRHYMFCELATRLYRMRNDDPESLAQFDDVCERHYAEMEVLRPALLAKFGVVPVVEMYRQAAIREQKAKRWDRTREWATRGLAFYGEQAAKTEVVDDLQKRLAHAEAKLVEASRPKQPRPPRTLATTSTSEPQMETLICEKCGKQFERVRARGRKPKECPSCRGEAVTASVTSS